MKQSDVADTKRKFNMLFQQSSMFKSLLQIIQECAKNLSRTFYFMPSKSCKRFVSFNEQDDSPQKKKVKKFKIIKKKTF